MEANQTVFQNLLNGQIQYRVPLFQRVYSWKEENWEQIWSDILEVYAMDKPRNHFIGSVVTQPIPDSPEKASKYMLIDGQQRMTTLLILLSAIRHRAQQNNDIWGSLAYQIEEECLINKYAIPDDHYKFLPTEQDREPFKSVMSGNIGEQHSQIFNAWSYFNQAISKGDIDEHDIDLRKLRNCITGYLDIVSITLDVDDSPNRIFESLNNTGMPLSVSDLIRNYLFMNISGWDQQKTAYDKYWYPMQQIFGSENDNRFSDFFWRYLMMKGNLERRDETYEGVRRLLGESSVTSQVASEFLAEFYRFSGYYAQLIQTQQPKFGCSISKRINRLNRWEVSVTYPFFMRALDYMDSGLIGRSELEDVMDMIESFIVRRAICGVPTNRLRRIFVQMSTQVKPNDFTTSAKQILLNSRWPADSEFREKFIQYRLYNPYRLSRTRLILDTLQISFGDKEGPDLSKPQITIEHIMPQTLSEEWECYLGTDATDIHNRWLHTIGNLTLTGYNSQLGNMPFSDKKPKLSKSNFRLSDSIQIHDKWNEESIQHRGSKLAERALRLWPR